MGKIRFRKAKKVVQVARVSAVDHGFDFSREQFLSGQNKKLGRLGLTFCILAKRIRGSSDRHSVRHLESALYGLSRVESSVHCAHCSTEPAVVHGGGTIVFCNQVSQ